MLTMTTDDDSATHRPTNRCRDRLHPGQGERDARDARGQQRLGRRGEQQPAVVPLEPAQVDLDPDLEQESTTPTSASSSAAAGPRRSPA